MEVNSNKIEVGWYAFEGGKFSPDPKAYPNLQGVVAWLNLDPNAPKGKRGLILMPDEVHMALASKCCETKICDEEDGQANTRGMIAYGKEYGVSFPAVEWCANYSKNGVKPGEVFLPALNQLKRIGTNQDIINHALKQIGGVLLHNWVWSSTECYRKGAWNMHANFGTVAWKYKDDPDYVRCVIAF